MAPNQTSDKKLFDSLLDLFGNIIRKCNKFKTLRVIYKHTCLDLYTLYKGPFSCPFQILSNPIYDCLFLSAESQTFYITSLFFPSLALSSWRISPPRRSLLEKLHREQSGWRCHKRKWQFRWENRNSDGGSDILPCSWTYESLYTRIHTLPGRKKYDVGRRKIFRGLSVPFSILWRRVPADVILRETRREITCRNYFWPMATIPRSIREQQLCDKLPQCVSFTYCTKYKYKCM